MAQKAKAPEKIRLLIVDDHPMMREGLCSLLANQADMEVVAEAENAGQAIELIASKKPHIVIADITLPGRSGIELIKDIAAMYPQVSSLAVSMHDESVYAERVLRAGARGYIMKKEGGKRILEAIRKVRAGDVAVSDRISAQILRIFSGRSGSGEESPLRQLTDREFEVFELIGRGLGTVQMAQELHISAKTVEVHRVHIKEKLQIRTGSELIAYAARWSQSSDDK
ncbi:MAG TPA: response regulator transcription factor [Chthoniobacteraceae bacterium]|jgi:DNA-binding NarL/FixJ family response regulator|nr:response regulator transcription factor [Chthoniobacteraceae bacterium]